MTPTTRERLLAVVALVIFGGLGLLTLQRTVLGERELSTAGLHIQHGPYPAELRARHHKMGSYGADPCCCFEPWMRYAADRLAAEGELPLWKDTSLCGAPLLGNGQSALFFPTHLAAILLGAPPGTQGLMALAKLVFGAWFAYLLGRHLRLSFAAAIVCGVTYGFTGAQASWLPYPHTNVGMLLPLLVLAADRAAQAPTGRRIALLAMVSGLQHLGGQPEVAFFSHGAAFVVAVARAVSLRGAVDGPSGWRRVGAVVAGGSLGTALGALAVLPLVEYVQHSDALGKRSAEKALPALREPLVAVGFLLCTAAAFGALRHLSRRAEGTAAAGALLFVAVLGGIWLGLRLGLTPSFSAPLSADWLGGPTRDRVGRPYHGAATVHFGPGLALAVLGVLFGAPRGLVRFTGAVLAVTLGVSLSAPVFHDLFAALPVVALTEPHRVVCVAVLAGSVLAGVGLDVLRVPDVTSRSAPRFVAATLAPTAAVALGVLAAVLAGTVGRAPAPPAPPPSVLPLDVELEPPPRTIDGLARYSGQFHTPSRPVWTRLFIDRSRRSLTMSSVEDADGGFTTHFRGATEAWRLPSLLTPVRIGVRTADGSEYRTEPHVPPQTFLTTMTWFPVVPVDRRAHIQLVFFLLVVLCAAAVLGRSRIVALLGRIAIVILVAIGAVSFAATIYPSLERELHYPDSPVMDALADLPPDGRVLFMRPPYLHELATWYGIPSIVGNDALFPRHTATLLRAALDDETASSPPQRLPNVTHPDLTLLGLMAGSHLLNYRAASPELPVVDYPGADALPGFRIVQNPRALPRARLVPRAVIEPDDARALERLTGQGSRPDLEVVLASGEALQATGSDPGTARIEVSHANRVAIAIEPQARAYLVLADSFHPGWTARVDGEPRPIHRANVAFRAVAVEPGDRLVEFVYAPGSFTLGAVTSGLAAAVVLLLILWRRTPSPTSPRDDGWRGR